MPKWLLGALHRWLLIAVRLESSTSLTCHGVAAHAGALRSFSDLWRSGFRAGGDQQADPDSMQSRSDEKLIPYSFFTASIGSELHDYRVGRNCDQCDSRARAEIIFDLEGDVRFERRLAAKQGWVVLFANGLSALLAFNSCFHRSVADSCHGSRTAICRCGWPGLHTESAFYQNICQIRYGSSLFHRGSCTGRECGLFTRVLC